LAAEQAIGRICGGKGNFNHLWQLVRALCALGLGGLVEPVLKTIKIDSASWQAQRAAVLEQAKLLPDGRAYWQSRSQRFSDNIQALSAANPALKDLHPFWCQHQDRYALFQANDGNDQVVDTQEPVIFSAFVGGLIDHRALARHWTYICRGYQMPRPIAFDGAGYGWVLKRVLESTQRTLHDFSCAVYIVEPDLASACILLNLHDLQPWAHRLRFFAGPTAQTGFEQAMGKHQNWDLPGTMVGERVVDRPALDLQASVAAVAEKRKRTDALLTSRITAHYANITLGDWAARFEAAQSNARPLKVLGLTSRYTTVLQYSLDELGQAIRAAGHEFILCKEPDDQCANVPDLSMIDEHKPDLVVTISRLRSENPRLPKNVPALCWDQDNLPCMRTDAARSGLDAFTYIAGLGARMGYQQLDWPKENCIFAFGAAATHRYGNQPVSAALLAKHRCTFSYTSNASALPESVVAEQRARYAADPAALSLYDRVSADVLARARSGYAWDTVQMEKLLDSHIACASHIAATLSPATRQEMIIHLRMLSDRAFRHVALSWVADYCSRNQATLRLYGSGWESHPRFAQYAAGFLAPGEEMRAVYQASQINLQIIETGFLHSRVLDGLAAGGFFLYRLAPEARDLDHTERDRLIMARRAVETGCVTYAQLDASLDPLIVKPWIFARGIIPPGKPDQRCRMLDIWQATPSEEIQFPQLDKITFSDQEQFNDMADRYLASPAMRSTVAEELRQIVIDRFSYDARWKQFLTGITAGLRSAAGLDSAAHVLRQRFSGQAA
jgi:hypothetical protein